MRSRPALPADAEAMTATIALAFEHDPIWGPAFGRADGSTDHLLPIWRLYVDRALETSTAWLADDGAAVALWTPPGGSELSDQQMSELDRIAEVNLSATQKADLDELFARFEANHP